MLINLSNHPLEYWSESQLSLARECWGQVVDLPFPAVDPRASLGDVQALAEEYCQKCMELLADTDGPSAVHLMGEMVFCYNLVALLKKEGICVVASTTTRNVRYSQSSKEVLFEFVTFREY